jgi:hypothetical protein
MADPRETLSHGTLTHVYTERLEEVLGMFPYSTSTPLDQPRLVKTEGLYQPRSQDPTMEGEMAVLYSEEYGVKIAQIFVAVPISGTLQWKTIQHRSGISNSQTGGPWNP